MNKGSVIKENLSIGAFVVIDGDEQSQADKKSIQRKLDDLKTARQNGGLTSSEEAEFLNLRRLQDEE